MTRWWMGFVLGLAAASAGAATPIYRCGQTYSQTPCPGGHILESSDPRTAAQRAEARRTAEREKALAEQMERERRSAPAEGAATATGFDARPPTAQAAASEPAKPHKKVAAKRRAAASAPGVVFIAPRPAAK